MELPNEAINEFIDIYRRKLGVELSFKDARMEAINFLELMGLITNKSSDQNK
jgi:hypothetical protein